MDLVVGATGLVGQQVALSLRRHGRRVRALVRGGKRREKAAPLLSAGIEVVDADLSKPESLPSACAGVETVLSTATSMPHGKETAAHPIKGSDRSRPGNPQTLDTAAAAGRVPTGLPLDGQIRELGLGAVQARARADRGSGRRGV